MPFDLIISWYDDDSTRLIASWVVLLLPILLWLFMFFVSLFNLIFISYQQHKYQNPLEVVSQSYDNSIDFNTLKQECEPHVSILRPLCGIEYELEENLESSFLQDYQNFELIFSVASKSDPACSIVKKLILKYPQVDAHLIVDDTQKGINPKVANLIKAYDRAKYDIVWVCDSNIFVNKSCLKNSIAQLIQPSVGLVHHLPIGVSANSFGANLEAMFLNTEHAKMYNIINLSQLAPCVVGKSCLYRRSSLAKLGGLKAFEHQLAEDFLIAKAIFDQNLTLVLSFENAFNRLGQLSFRGFLKRRIRWCRLRKVIVPFATLIEPFTECLVNGLLASLALNHLANIPVLPFLTFHWLAWLILDLQLVQLLLRHQLSGKELLYHIIIWAFREIMALPIYFYAIFGSTFTWRGQRYRITSGSFAVPDHGESWLQFFSHSFYSWFKPKLQ